MDAISCLWITLLVDQGVQLIVNAAPVEEEHELIITTVDPSVGYNGTRWGDDRERVVGGIVVGVIGGIIALCIAIHVTIKYARIALKDKKKQSQDQEYEYSENELDTTYDINSNKGDRSGSLDTYEERKTNVKFAIDEPSPSSPGMTAMGKKRHRGSLETGRTLETIQSSVELQSHFGDRTGNGGRGHSNNGFDEEPNDAEDTAGTPERGVSFSVG